MKKLQKVIVLCVFSFMLTATVNAQMYKLFAFESSNKLSQLCDSIKAAVDSSYTTSISSLATWNARTYTITFEDTRTGGGFNVNVEVRPVDNRKSTDSVICRVTIDGIGGAIQQIWKRYFNPKCDFTKVKTNVFEGVSFMVDKKNLHASDQEFNAANKFWKVSQKDWKIYCTKSLPGTMAINISIM